MGRTASLDIRLSFPFHPLPSLCPKPGLSRRDDFCTFDNHVALFAGPEYKVIAFLNVEQLSHLAWDRNLPFRTHPSLEKNRLVHRLLLYLYSSSIFLFSYFLIVELYERVGVCQEQNGLLLVEIKLQRMVQSTPAIKPAYFPRM
jgi:hypothetical protein